MTTSRFTSELLEGSLQLKPFPSVAMRVLDLHSKDDTTARELTAVVETDAAITSRVLTLANSSFFGFAQDIDSIEQAGVRLGVDRLTELCMASAAQTHFAPSGYLGYRTLEFLWQRSFLTAHAARKLAQDSDGEVAATSAFTAGLLSELGHQVMYQLLSPEVIDAACQLVLAGQPLCEAEEMVVGIDHASLAATLLGFWEFPEELAKSVGMHHDQGCSPLSALVGRAGRYAASAQLAMRDIEENLAWMLDHPLDLDDGTGVREAMQAAMAMAP